MLYWRDFIKRYFQNPSGSYETPEESSVNSSAKLEDIQKLEKKLGFVLPTSYRTFLETADGMMLCYYEIFRTSYVKSLSNSPDYIRDIQDIHDTFDSIYIEILESNNWSTPIPEEFYQLYYNRDNEIVDTNGNIKKKLLEMWVKKHPEHPFAECMEYAVLPIKKEHLHKNLIFIGEEESQGVFYYINPYIKISKDEFEILEYFPRNGERAFTENIKF